MGFKVEHNSMIRLIEADNIFEVELDKVYEIKRDNARLYPVNIPILLLKEDWTVIGYAVVIELELDGTGIELEFKLISKFNKEVSEQYTKDLMEALKITGYL